MTGGSGINHVECDYDMPTAWAISPGGLCFLKNPGLD
jgi:hypothetical protein